MRVRVPPSASHNQLIRYRLSGFAGAVQADSSQVIRPGAQPFSVPQAPQRMSSVAVSALSNHRWLRRLVGAIKARTLPLAIFLFSTMLLFSYEPFSRFETGDNALYDYIAQSILRGQLSYRDIVDVKGPGSTYLSALAIEIGRHVGGKDVLAIRLLYVVLTGLLCLTTYTVAKIYLRSRLAALIAALAPLAVSRYCEFTTAGTEPKLLMILFGVLSLLMIAKDKPLLAGIWSMLASLCWQPGLMFTGVAFLIHSRYLTSWRNRRAMKVLIGATIPLAIVVLCFCWLFSGLPSFEHTDTGSEKCGRSSARKKKPDSLVIWLARTTRCSFTAPWSCWCCSTEPTSIRT